jgi:hypothetical protein
VIAHGKSSPHLRETLPVVAQRVVAQRVVARGSRRIED